jgi:hypothetical protein
MLAFLSRRGVLLRLARPPARAPQFRVSGLTRIAIIKTKGRTDMKQKLLLIFFLFAAAVCLLLIPKAYAVDLFDGKVVIHGKISEQLLMRARGNIHDELHSYDFYNARSTLKLETMWHAYEGPEYMLNIYGVWKNFYDIAHEFDSGYKNYLRDFSGDSSHGIEELKSYETFRDICRELFVELTHNLYQVRIGKQIVSWGDLGFERMADIVNPIDHRGNLNMAYPDFAEIKRGLWMLRLYYTPEGLPMDMNFEFLVIPDFQPTRNWPAGYHLTHPPSLNAMQNPNEQFLSSYRDKPTSWSQPEFGFRVRGYLAGFDWTLQYLHHRNDDPIIRPGRIMAATLPALLGWGRAEDVNHFYWLNSFGFTFNKPVDTPIPVIPGTTFKMSGSVLSMEAIYDLNKDCTAVDGAKNMVKEYDRMAVALQWKTKIFLPYITPMFRNEYLNSETSIFMEWLEDKHNNYYIYPYVSYRQKGHHWSMTTQMFNMELTRGNMMFIPAIYAAYYNTQGGGYYAPALAFKPTFGWTFIFRYFNYFDLQHGVNDKDYFTFEITYEF